MDQGGKNLWTAVEVYTSIEAVEAVAARLRDLGARGVAIDEADPLGPGFVPKFGELNEPEDPVGQAGGPDRTGGEAVVSGYWPGEPARWRSLVADLERWVRALSGWGLDPGRGEIAIRTIREAEWADAWKRYYRPVTVRGRSRTLTVCPEWESYDPAPGEVVVRIDPGMAFGTGTHETTRLCLEWLVDRVTPGCRVLDVGCGSGILSVAAAKLGAVRVLAVDLDPLAVDAAGHNAKVAGVSDRVEVRRGDLLSGADERADILVANLLADLVERLLPDVRGHLLPGGVFVASGILVEQEKRIALAMEGAGLRVNGVRREGAWAALAARVADTAAGGNVTG